MKLGFEEYMKQYNAQFKTFKQKVKEDKEQSIGGYRLEQHTLAILTMTGMNVVKTMPRIDICFGADFLVSYKEDDINYSVYVDVTTNKTKDIKYIQLNGTLVDNYIDAFKAEFGFGRLSFGLKTKHRGRFEYEKPVIVLVFSDVNLKGKGIDVTDTEVRLIETFIKSLNTMLVSDFKCNKRASKIFNI